ncbi:MAG: 30S ribosomal protein S6 [Verrucomicrobiota bacterium]
MKRKYEGVLVLNTDDPAAPIDEIVQNVGREIEAEGAQLDEIDNLGRRDFAYESNRKKTSGHYVNYVFEAEPEVVDKIQTKLKLNTNVHLQHYQRV